MLYMQLNNNSKAVKYFNKSVLLSPFNYTYRYNLAVLLDKMGDIKNASILYRQLIAASQQGKVIPENPHKINERLIYLSAK